MQKRIFSATLSIQKRHLLQEFRSHDKCPFLLSTYLFRFYLFTTISSVNTHTPGLDVFA